VIVIAKLIGLDLIGLDLIGLDLIGLDLIGLDLIGYLVSLAVGAGVSALVSSDSSDAAKGGYLSKLPVRGTRPFCRVIG